MVSNWGNTRNSCNLPRGLADRCVSTGIWSAHAEREEECTLAIRTVAGSVSPTGSRAKGLGLENMAPVSKLVTRIRPALTDQGSERLLEVQ